MKPTAFIVLMFLSLSACSKQDSDLAFPVKKTVTNQGASLVDFSGKWDHGAVQLQFTLSGNLSNVTAFKIFSGSSSNQLCLIGELDVTVIQTPSTFSFNDPAPKGSPTYYMIGIEDNQGHITYLNSILSVSKPSGLGK
ncbi:MAG: hypothetical protein EPN39_02275 [Chitinophagaceae bacterium]|nr:MAG: hypothetical protein EPN39_02275 [Chitinophagaceae bacterium]